MINNQLMNPDRIVVVGGSNNLHKPGGKIVENIIKGGYSGHLYVINPKEDEVQGIRSYHNITECPEADLAILAIASKYCVQVIEELAANKGVRAFIVISSGFSEESDEGARVEKEMIAVVNRYNACLIGPNCIGMITSRYSGVFTSPVPRLSVFGCDFVSGSGATAVFIIESALPKGLTFSRVFSVGNSAQIGVEDVLEYWDETYEAGRSSGIKLIYVEKIANPDKLLKHAASLIRKGCKIAAIKAGSTEAGSRAASSHTGAIASSDLAVEALFRKAGIVRCFGREEMTTVASVFMYKELTGKNIAIITHAGGPAVMLTDALTAGGLNIPAIEGKHRKELLAMMNPGAAAGNPIDLMATNTTEQLFNVIEYVDKKLDFIDGIIVIFGSTGLIDVTETYDMLHRKIQDCNKPILPILPSISSTHKEIEYFLSKGHINFPDEVLLGRALTKVYNTPFPADDKIYFEGVDIPRIRKIIDDTPSGFIEPSVIHELLGYASISVVPEGVARKKKELIQLAQKIGFPLAIKVIGPVHKSDVGGVTLNIKSETHLVAEFHRMMKIKGVKSVLLQQMITGMELFIGATYEPHFGHVILCGLGGIFVEVLHDVSSGLAPLTFNEAYSMIRNLKSYKIIQGTRGQEGINEERLAEILVRLSSLLRFATEIKEMDLNPLIGNSKSLTVVDARIRIEK
ncbi:MAG: acetate--CoA ligase family protein [Bacteroidales bacterium]|nr:acetate--CoA ligase family protein [Bacteroidales bacterium]